MAEETHRESLEEQATHAESEARMLLPGVQTILGFQLMAVFNQRFEHFSEGEQLIHYGAFLLTALTMALMMAPAAYHRQAERDRVTRRFVDLASRLLTISMIPFTAGMCLDTYLVGRLITHDSALGLAAAAGMLITLSGLWFVLPLAFGQRR
jgi:hypothetical protein